VDAASWGCSLENSPKNWSGESLTFTTGLQWILHTRNRGSPHAQLRIGGQKVTQEYLDPVLKRDGSGQSFFGTEAKFVHSQYAKDFEATGFSMSMGGGGLT
jgi:hypothetical protein